MPSSRPIVAFLATLLAAASLQGCAGTVKPGPPITSCETLELRDPSGARIDLSGEWSANDEGQYKLKQVGDCLTWVGLSFFEDQSLGDSWITTFRGRIRTDRTISGEFLDVFSTAPGSGTLELLIADEADAYGGLTLTLTKATGSPFGGSFWERVPPPEEEPLDPNESDAPGESGSGESSEPSLSLEPVESPFPTESPSPTESQ
jgi:hypothetical protein